MPLSFAIGKPPRNPLLDTEPEWSQVPGYGDSMAHTLRAIGTGLILAALLALTWRFLVTDGLPLEASPALSSILLVFLIATVAHEIFHLAVFPSFGLKHGVVGIWPQMGAIYVQYLLPVTRGRFIAATLSPAIAISVFPLVLGLSGFQVPAFIQWATIVNAVAAGADLLAVTVLLRETSARDLVLDSNHALFRREA
jgi:hypothetical protein